MEPYASVALSQRPTTVLRFQLRSGTAGQASKDRHEFCFREPPLGLPLRRFAPF